MVIKTKPKQPGGVAWLKTAQFIAKITLAICLLCSLSFAQKPKVAVYVSEQSGYSEDVKNALRIATVNVIVRGGKYEVVERSSVIDEELSKQASGAVDDDQMVAFGRQAGARYVCVSDITQLAFGSNSHTHQVSARIIDVETAQLIGLGVIDQNILTAPDMSTAITKAVERMLETISDKIGPNLPKKAVYIQGGVRNSQNANALYTYTLEALFTRSRYNGDFVVVERSDAFTRQIEREHGEQRSGAVADNEISRMGKQYGITEVCIASIEFVMGTYNINARLVNVERASVVNASKLRHLGERPESGKLNNLRYIAMQMVEDMIPRTKEEIEKESEREKAQLAAEQEANRTALMMGVLIGGGVSLQMDEVNPNFYESTGGQFTASVEFYRSSTSFFRYGLNFDFGSFGINRDALREAYPNADPSSFTSTYFAKPGAFLKLHPFSFIYLSGGASYGLYGVNAKNSSGKATKVAKVSTLVFPAGAGLILGPVLLEGQCNIVPFKGRVAKYLSFNAGYKFDTQLDKQEDNMQLDSEMAKPAKRKK